MTTDDVIIAKVASVDDMRQFLKRLKIQGRNFVIKPNWSNANTFTSAQALDLLFNCLNGDKIVIEGYTAWRNELNTGPEPEDIITPSNAKRMWKWIKEQDQWFLRFSGIETVLRKCQVRYINVTEEVWSGRAIAWGKIQDLVERKFDSIRNPEMYGFIPEEIYASRGYSFISLNLSRKTREVMSLSTKNLFGLIPDPARYGKWHGENDALLPQSIVDINKIYRSLFKRCFWINELKDHELLVGSNNSALADIVTAKIMGVDPEKIEYLKRASKVFGGYKKTAVTKALKELKSA